MMSSSGQQISSPTFIQMMKTLELYSLQEHYISHYIRDYYVQIDGRDGKELEVTGIYTPVLENGERTTNVAMESENKYN